MFTFDIFRNDYLSVYNEIREIVSKREDEDAKAFLIRLDELAQRIKK